MKKKTPPSELQCSLQGHRGAINNVIFNKKGDYCISCGNDRRVILWNPYTGRYISEFKGHTNDVKDVKVVDKTILTFDTLRGKVVRKFYGHTQSVNCISYNSKNTIIGSGSYDKTIRIWDVLSRGNNKPIQILDDCTDSISSIEIIDPFILCGSLDGSVRVYDIRIGKLKVYKMSKRKSGIGCVKFTNNLKCIMVNTLDSKMKLIDFNSGDVLNAYYGHKNRSYRLYSSVSSDNKFVSCGSEDNKIFIWDFVSGKVVRTLYGHKRTVTCVSYHQSKNMLLSGSNDGSVKVWK